MTAISTPTPQRDEPIIHAESLGKRFRLYPRAWQRPAEWLSVGRACLHEDFWAVRDVSFSLRRGQCLGVIGPNGSGKSTLLKMIAGSLTPTTGDLHVTGRVLSLIELNAGLDPNLTGRQNVRHLASMLAFPRGYAERTMPRIEAFAEINHFFDRPVRLYSTGMRVRLGFSMFACFEPEVFLVDEALSVGDALFQQKCAARIRQMLASGTTMMFVSHDTAAVLALCDHAMLLHKGCVMFHGAPAEAVSRYYSLLGAESGRTGSKWRQRLSDSADHAPPSEDPDLPPVAAESSLGLTPSDIESHDVIQTLAAERHGLGDLRIVAAAITDAQARHTLTIPLGETLSIHLLIEASRDVARPRAGLRIHDRLGTYIFSAGTDQLGCRLPPLAAGQRAIVRLDVTMNLRPDPYTLALTVSEPGDGPNANAIFHDQIDRIGPIDVAPPSSAHLPFFGLVQLPMHAAYQSCPAVAIH